MTDAQNPIEIKAPHEAILDLPQERITGDILRGRGPRRGNLETLIKYWRPIMRKPGGFRRCLVILADHPELYPLERICAWLHHETTGMWPNEGNHHAGGKLGAVVKRTVKKGKRKRRKKDAIAGVDFPIRRLEMRLEQQNKSQMYAPLDGTPEQMLWKAGKLRRAEQTVGSLLLPGEGGSFKPRHIIAGALTPGGSGLPGPGSKPARSRLGIRGGSATDRGFRCPSGFQHGGKFTDKGYTTCGAQLFAVPGSLGANRTVIGAGGNRRTQVGTVGAPAAGTPTPTAGAGTQGRRVLPPAIGRPNPNLYATSVGKTEKEASAAPSGSPFRRIVRSDGTVMEPISTLEILSQQEDNPDLLNATYISNVPSAEKFGSEELELMKTGLKKVSFSLPGGGVASVTRDSDGPMEPGAARSFGKALTGAQKLTLPEMDLAGILRETAAKTDAATFAVTVPGAREDLNRSIRVTRDGSARSVPTWVYRTFLSEDAPGRAPGTKPYKLVTGVKTVRRDASTQWGPLEYTASSIPEDRDDDSYHNYLRFKAMSWHDETEDTSLALQEAKAKAVWDIGIDRFRCPPGTPDAGQLTNRFGVGCAAAAVRAAGRAVGSAVRRSNNDGKPNVGTGTGTRKPRVPGRRPRQPGRRGALLDRMSNAIDPDGSPRGERRGELLDRMADAIDPDVETRRRRGGLLQRLGDIIDPDPTERRRTVRTRRETFADGLGREDSNVWLPTILNHERNQIEHDWGRRLKKSTTDIDIDDMHDHLFNNRQDMTPEEFNRLQAEVNDLELIRDLQAGPNGALLDGMDQLSDDRFEKARAAMATFERTLNNADEAERVRLLRRANEDRTDFEIERMQRDRDSSLNEMQNLYAARDLGELEIQRDRARRRRERASEELERSQRGASNPASDPDANRENQRRMEAWRDTNQAQEDYASGLLDRGQSEETPTAPPAQTDYTPISDEINVPESRLDDPEFVDNETAQAFQRQDTGEYFIERRGSNGLDPAQRGFREREDDEGPFTRRELNERMEEITGERLPRESTMERLANESRQNNARIETESAALDPAERVENPIYSWDGEERLDGDSPNAAALEDGRDGWTGTARLVSTDNGWWVDVNADNNARDPQNHEDHQEELGPFSREEAVSEVEKLTGVDLNPLDPDSPEAAQRDAIASDNENLDIARQGRVTLPGRDDQIADADREVRPRDGSGRIQDVQDRRAREGDIAAAQAEFDRRDRGRSDSSIEDYRENLILTLGEDNELIDGYVEIEETRRAREQRRLDNRIEEIEDPYGIRDLDVTASVERVIERSDPDSPIGTQREAREAATAALSTEDREIVPEFSSDGPDRLDGDNPNAAALTELADGWTGTARLVSENDGWYVDVQAQRNTRDPQNFEDGEEQLGPMSRADAIAEIDRLSGVDLSASGGTAAATPDGGTPPAGTPPADANAPSPAAQALASPRFPAEPNAQVFEQRNADIPEPPAPPSTPRYDVEAASPEVKQAVVAEVLQYREVVDDFYYGQLGPSYDSESIDSFTEALLANSNIQPGRRNEILRRRQDWASFQEAGSDPDALANIPNVMGESRAHTLLQDTGAIPDRRRNRTAPDPEPVTTMTTGLGLSDPREDPVVSTVSDAPWTPSSAVRSSIPDPVETDASADAIRARERFGGGNPVGQIRSNTDELNHQVSLFETGATDNPDQMLLAANQATDDVNLAVLSVLQLSGISTGPNDSTSDAIQRGLRALGQSNDPSVNGMNDTIIQLLRDRDQANARMIAALDARDVSYNYPEVTATLSQAARVQESMLAEALSNGFTRRQEALRVRNLGVQASPHYAPNNIEFPNTPGEPLFFMTEGSRGNAARIELQDGIGRAFAEFKVDGTITDVPEGVKVPYQNSPVPGMQVSWRKTDSDLSVDFHTADGAYMGNMEFQFYPFREADGTYKGRVRVKADLANFHPEYQDQGIATDAASKLLFNMGDSVGEANTLANITVGKYAWAGKGFDFTSGRTPPDIQNNAKIIADFLENPTGVREKRAAIKVMLGGLNNSSRNGGTNELAESILGTYLDKKDEVLDNLRKISTERYTSAIEIARLGKYSEGWGSGVNGVNWHPGRVLMMGGDATGWAGIMRIDDSRTPERLAELLQEGVS